MVEFRVLGPVEVTVDGRPVPLAAAKPRALLALLLLDRDRPVSAGTLIDGLWGEEPPDTATKALQGYVSQLRKALGADRIETRAAGYLLTVEEDECDLDRFEERALEGHELLAEGDPAGAAALLGEALALWRGEPFAEFEAEPFARARARLEALRLATLEDRIEADLALGNHARLVPELEALAAREPFRERVAGLLMVALYRSGRQADALEAYRRTRARLVEELGIEPGEDLQELHRAILRHDDSLVLPPSDVSVGPPRPRPTHWYHAALGVALVVPILAISIGYFFVRGGWSPSERNMAPGTRAFMHKLEVFLDQSQKGRRQVVDVVDQASRCRLNPALALAQLDYVQANRQSLLQAVAALNVPDDDAAVRVSDLFQQAIQSSISADQYYRGWLARRKGCVLGAHPDLKAARAADAEATRAKVRFVAAFNRLARPLNLRQWKETEF
jgi:DNA-binding SARP family transcriptional activator